MSDNNKQEKAINKNIRIFFILYSFDFQNTNIIAQFIKIVY